MRVGKHIAPTNFGTLHPTSGIPEAQNLRPDDHDGSRSIDTLDSGAATEGDDWVVGLGDSVQERCVAHDRSDVLERVRLRAILPAGTAVCGFRVARLLMFCARRAGRRRAWRGCPAPLGRDVLPAPLGSPRFPEERTNSAPGVLRMCRQGLKCRTVIIVPPSPRGGHGNFVVVAPW